LGKAGADFRPQSAKLRRRTSTPLGENTRAILVATLPRTGGHAAIYGVADLSKAIPTNTAASAKQRLLNRARAKKEDVNLLLTKYTLERVLYRIANGQTETPSFYSRPIPAWSYATRFSSSPI
jgi:hypothetical protein